MDAVYEARVSAWVAKRDDNSKSVVKILTHVGYTDDGDSGNDPEPAGAVLDGVTVTQGYGGTLDGSSGFGAGVYALPGSNPNIAYCTFTNNRATGRYSRGGAIRARHASTISYCTFRNNAAIGENSHGGAVSVHASSSVSHSTFNNNRAIGAGSAGGAIFVSNSSTISYCTFNNNTAYYAGAVYAFSGSFVTHCTLYNNTASRGGALQANDSTISYCTFRDNAATEHNGAGGGAATIYGASLSHCTFTNNTADGTGGAINTWSGSTISHCIFTNNSVTKANSLGGAIYAHTTTTISHCAFNNNSVTGSGGAIRVWSSSSISHCTLYNNKASVNGGGMYVGPSTTIRNCIILGNVASAGGADGDQIWNANTNASAKPVFSHCIIQGGNGGIQGVSSHKFTSASIINASSAAAVFVSVVDGAEDLRLKDGSPAIDVGDNNVASGVAFDLDGNARLFGTKVDLGAYEFIDADFVGKPTVTNVTQTTAIFNHYANQAGTVHYVVLEADATAPADLDELKAADGSAFVTHANKPTSATATNITGLKSDTLYKLYYILEANSGPSTALEYIAFREPTTLYVNAASAAAPEAMDGSTWDKAYDDLQSALIIHFLVAWCLLPQAPISHTQMTEMCPLKSKMASRSMGGLRAMRQALRQTIQTPKLTKILEPRTEMAILLMSLSFRVI